MKAIYLFKNGKSIEDCSEDRVIVEMSYQDWAKIRLYLEDEETRKKCKKAADEAQIDWVD